MPGFCVNCGTPLSGAFCNKCGTRAVSPGAPTEAPTPLAAPPAITPEKFEAQPAFQPVNVPITPAKSSGTGKILLWVGGILLALFVAGTAAAVYGVYWVKHKVTNFASSITQHPGDSVKVATSGDSCRLLSVADLQKIVGVPIEKSAEITDGDQPGCAYYTNQQAFNQLQRIAAQQAKRQADEQSKKPGPKGDNPLLLLKDANQMEGIVKALGMSQPSGDGRVFSFTVQRGFDGESWTGMRVAESAVPGFEEVAGVGDHAMIGAFGHAFYVLKGDTMVTMVTMWVPNARARGSEIGKKIIGNL